MFDRGFFFEYITCLGLHLDTKDFTASLAFARYNLSMPDKIPKVPKRNDLFCPHPYLQTQQFKIKFSSWLWDRLIKHVNDGLITAPVYDPNPLGPSISVYDSRSKTALILYLRWFDTVINSLDDGTRNCWVILRPYVGWMVDVERVHGLKPRESKSVSRRYICVYCGYITERFLSLIS